MADTCIRFVQFPHPGTEHVSYRHGRRAWPLASAAHRRTFLSGGGAFRWKVDGSDEQGDLQFWGEWEGEARVVRALDAGPQMPRWLCRPESNGQLPESDDGTPPQNTDPFVWGEAMRYSVCRQPTNRKLRELAPGSLVLFGSSLAGAFVVDTVFVVAGSFAHSRRDYRELARRTSAEHMRATIEPWYGWETDDDTVLRMYVGATPASTVEGMFSFVPCLPADAGGFARPEIRLPGLVNPNLRMQAACVSFDDAGAMRQVWNEVTRQIVESGLALATRIEL
jgi:hypothetical protein